MLFIIIYKNQLENKYFKPHKEKTITITVNINGVIKIKNKLYKLLPFLSGITNSLLGAGGGILAVSYFKSKGMEQKKAQAAALVTTFVLSAISCIYYAFQGYMQFNDALVYVPCGVVGAVLGVLLLKIMPDKILRKLFAVIILWAGARMLTGR